MAASARSASPERPAFGRSSTFSRVVTATSVATYVGERHPADGRSARPATAEPPSGASGLAAGIASGYVLPTHTNPVTWASTPGR